jgi:hypothetical protein
VVLPPVPAGAVGIEAVGHLLPNAGIIGAGAVGDQLGLTSGAFGIVWSAFGSLNLPNGKNVLHAAGMLSIQALTFGSIVKVDLSVGHASCHAVGLSVGHAVGHAVGQAVDLSVGHAVGPALWSAPFAAHQTFQASKNDWHSGGGVGHVFGSSASWSPLAVGVPVALAVEVPDALEVPELDVWARMMPALSAVVVESTAPGSPAKAIPVAVPTPTMASPAALKARRRRIRPARRALGRWFAPPSAMLDSADAESAMSCSARWMSRVMVCSRT